MLKDFSDVSHIYLATGYTDLRKGIDGLASIVQQTFKLDPFEEYLFVLWQEAKQDKGTLLG
jgi:transposase